ncbi:MAG TPA: hypothetical protein VFA09_16250 [Ktedonobacteraceae bacterium]|nr:hypothetical protein [Ktedonobacteraceae bacterium]
MKNTYAAALVFMAIIVPIPLLAAFVTAISYIILGQQFGSTTWLNWVALVSGLGITLLVWLIAAIFCRRRATAQYSNRISYDAIVQELTRLKINYDHIDMNNVDEELEGKEIVEALVAGQAVEVVDAVNAGETAIVAPAVGSAGVARANGATESPQQNSDNAALERAYADLYGEQDDDSIEGQLKKNGIQWVLGSGYIDIWNRLQAADQEMIAVLPKETLVADADYDLLRLDGSTIPNSQHWIDVINKAKATLERVDKQKKAQKKPADHTQQVASEQQLLGQALLDLIKATVSSSKLPLDDANIPTSLGPALFSLLKNAFTDPQPEVQETEAQAREGLRQARIAINSYITNRWAGLIESRNRLMGSSFFASTFILILFVIAILGNAPASSLLAGLVFFFVGAVAGLFPRLTPQMVVSRQPSGNNKLSSKANNASGSAGAHSAKAAGQSNGARANGNGKSAAQNGSARSNGSSSDDRPPSDDYGLTIARVLVTPVFSGLAALIGVVLASMLSIALVSLTPVQSSNNAVTPTRSAVVATATPTAALGPATAPVNRVVPNYPSLDQVYSLTTNVQGVIFAAIFGFLPSLVINALQKEAALIMGQLKSTDPGEDGHG